MADLRVLLLTAVIPEARALARAFCLKRVPGKLPVWRSGDLALACVGIRAGRIGELTAVLKGCKAQVIVMAGVAGALSPELRVGDVVVDGGSCGAALPALGRARMGRLLTAEQLVSSEAQKSQLFASSGCLAVDMETDLARRFATEHGAAFLAVRGISDAASEALDPQLLTLIDGEGRPRIGRAMAMIVRRPNSLRSLLRLQRSTAKAMDAVAETLKVIIASRWPAEMAGRRAKM